ncbi:hypothetical protein [Amycolatopsis lurida]|uniref:hypothetical protein n=1 Tax=Amycolatopsis lurida TaxID=31959 RepID=UPI0036677615
MHHMISHALHKVAYLRNGCDILISQLKEVDRLASRVEELTPMQEAAMATADGNTTSVEEHLNLAISYASIWKYELNNALSAEPS